MDILIFAIATIFTFTSKVQAFDGPPPMGAHREPGMDRERPFGDLKFEFKAEDKIFKDEDEAKSYQALFDKNKDSEEVNAYFAQNEKKKKEKMDEMRKSNTRPDFSKMKNEREAEMLSMIKDLKAILDKKKVLIAKTTNDSVKCEAGKSAPVLEKPTTDSLKDSSKVVKIVLTEEEFARMKKDIKEEVKKEMISDMAKNKPKENEEREKERGGPRERKGDAPSDDDKEERKMARSKGSRKSKRSQSDSMEMGGMGQDSGMMAFFTQQNAGMQMNQNQQNQFQFQNSSMQMQAMNMNQNYGGQMNRQGQQGRQMQIGGAIGYNFSPNQNYQGYGYQQQQQQMPMMVNNNMYASSQLNSGSYSNYNNQNVWMYGQNQGQSSYFNPYATTQYQYPMMTMGN